ncbi:hypothetical protein ACE38V_01445 [Cytobacillus sp. Hz8]|uniref:hypothetical protein n=1 Tax=Cytobacillus sp. Hz8 TaxID=3347168 RepID=UPI0035E2BE9E
MRYEKIPITDFWYPFIKSYQNNGRVLTKEWLQQAKLLDLIALCQLLNKESCGENRIKDIKRLIINMMEDWNIYDKVQREFASN